MNAKCHRVRKLFLFTLLILVFVGLFVSGKQITNVLAEQAESVSAVDETELLQEEILIEEGFSFEVETEDGLRFLLYSREAQNEEYYRQQTKNEILGEFAELFDE